MEMSLDNLLTTLQAANRLGISQRRVQAMVEAGRLPAQKVGGHWFMPLGAVRRQKALASGRGRRLDADNAWVLLSCICEANGDKSILPQAVSSWSWRRLRRRTRRETLSDLSSRLVHRAKVVQFKADPANLAALSDDEDLVLSGTSVADRYDFDIITSDLEAYVRREAMPGLAHRYGLVEWARRPNVTLHVPPNWPFAPGVQITPAPVAILDLMESEDPRTRNTGCLAATAWNCAEVPSEPQAIRNDVEWR